MPSPGPGPGGALSKLKITTPTVIKAEPGVCYRVSVTTSSSVSVSACYDAITTAVNAAGVTAANLFFEVAASTKGVTELQWPCGKGIVAVPGTGAVMAISYT